MSTTQHTPGPWYLGFEHPAIVESRRCGSDFLPIPGENWHWKIVRLTTPAGDFLVTGENDTATARQANARLIASAPDLLAELTQCIDIMVRAVGERLPIQQGTHSEEQDWGNTLRKARAIIARATGTAPEWTAAEAKEFGDYRSNEEAAEAYPVKKMWTEGEGAK